MPNGGVIQPVNSMPLWTFSRSLEPVAFAYDLHDCGMIEHCGGKRCIPCKCFIPAAERQVWVRIIDPLSYRLATGDVSHPSRVLAAAPPRGRSPVGRRDEAHLPGSMDGSVQHATNPRRVVARVEDVPSAIE